MSTKKIINEILSLPVEERALIVDSILRSLNPTQLNIDQRWLKVAKERLDELKAGKVKAIPGNDVFKGIRQKYSS